MIKKILAVAALATVALTFMPSDEAEARRGGGARAGGFRAAPAARARVIGVRPVFVRRPVRIVRRAYIAPLVITGGSCLWLRQRALATGSAYWWRRYRICRGY